MSWFSRCSWCGGPFNSGNCRHCTNISFGDEPVYDSNPNSYNQTPKFSNPLPHHNYKTNRSDTGAAFQAEFAKFQQNFERFMAQLKCSHCGGLFNGGNFPSCSIVGAGNEFFHDPYPFPYDNTPDFYDQPPQHNVETYSCELCGNNSHYGFDYPPRVPLVANISTYTPEPSRRYNYEDDDDDEEYSIPLNKMPQILWYIALAPVSSIMEPKDSLIMGDEHLNTIPEKESDKFIKFSVEGLIPIPSESEDTSEGDSEYDLPSCDDFSSINVPCDNSVTLSNPLFDSNNDFTSSDDESLSDEDVPEDNRTSESEDSYVSKLDEPDLIVTPLSAFNKDECFDPGGDIDEIDAFLDIVVSSDFEDDY
ncbi:hypothetical protein Tco_1135174 [Tanacetum coccineum]